MLLDRTALRPDELHARTGWEIRPEGACRGDECVPLPAGALDTDGTIDVAVFAERMGMPLVAEVAHGLWALGPRAGGRVLESVEAPGIMLGDFAGGTVDVGALAGRKVLLLAWASW